MPHISRIPMSLCVMWRKNKSEQINILDIGTGSGSITVSLAKYIENSKVMSFDISDIPLEVGKI